MVKGYVTYQINEHADYVFKRASELDYLWFKGHKASLVHFFARLLEECMPLLSDKNVSMEELKKLYNGFEVAVMPNCEVK